MYAQREWLDASCAGGPFLFRHSPACLPTVAHFAFFDAVQSPCQVSPPTDKAGAAPAKLPKPGQVRVGPGLAASAAKWNVPGHAEPFDFVWVQVKHAIKKELLSKAKKKGGTWWPARRVSSAPERTWLESQNLLVAGLDERSDLCLCQLFDDPGSLVAVRADKDGCLRPFDYGCKPPPAAAAAKCGKKAGRPGAFKLKPAKSNSKGKKGAPPPRVWADALAKKSFLGRREVAKKYGRPYLRTAKQWLNVALAHAGEACESDDEGVGLDDDEEEEEDGEKNGKGCAGDEKATVRARRAALLRQLSVEVKDEDLKPEVWQQA